MLKFHTFIVSLGFITITSHMQRKESMLGEYDMYTPHTQLYQIYVDPGNGKRTLFSVYNYTSCYM